MHDFDFEDLEDTYTCDHCRRDVAGVTRVPWCSPDCRVCNSCLVTDGAPDQCVQDCLSDLLDDVRRTA